MRLSPCHRFVVLDDVHVDREVVFALATWSAHHGMPVQDAIQFALLSFSEMAARSVALAPEPDALLEPEFLRGTS
jgi:hypothetical protein